MCEDLRVLACRSLPLTLQASCAFTHHEIHVGEGHSVAVRVTQGGVERNSSKWPTVIVDFAEVHTLWAAVTTSAQNTALLFAAFAGVHTSNEGRPSSGVEEVD